VHSVCLPACRYANSNCVTYREKAFDMLVGLATELKTDAPVCIGKCCGSHPTLKRQSKRVQQVRLMREGRTRTVNILIRFD
jgi:hypothetical protein